jgi:hypothetical protein
MSNALPYLVGTLELGLALGGAVLLWRLGLSPAARTRPAPAILGPWDAPATEFFTFVALVVLGSFLAAAGGGWAAKSLALRGDAVTVCSGAAAQLGMLAGVAAYRFGIEKRPFGPALSQPGIFSSGAVTFLISLPLLIATATGWEFLLKQLGLPAERQDLIAMFANAESPWLLAVMIALAVLIAPLTEEFVFRAGFFRFLRTRIPRRVALLLPALVFAALHVNWQTLQGLASLAPLVVLAVVFSLAYEHTGRIGTAIVAHACFNLNTILVILSGITA